MQNFDRVKVRDEMRQIDTSEMVQHVKKLRNWKIVQSNDTVICRVIGMYRAVLKSRNVEV